MSTNPNEADARILIDDQLRAAGWNPADKSQVRTEVTVQSSGAVGQVEESSAAGRADYVLLDQRGRALAVIEAKRQAIQPYVAKQQALPYAKQVGAPFIFLTNGELIYFWDYQNDDARIVEFVLLAPRPRTTRSPSHRKQAACDHPNPGDLYSPG